MQRPEYYQATRTFNLVFPENFSKCLNDVWLVQLFFCSTSCRKDLNLQPDQNNQERLPWNPRNSYPLDSIQGSFSRQSRIEAFQWSVSLGCPLDIRCSWIHQAQGHLSKMIRTPNSRFSDIPPNSGACCDWMELIKLTSVFTTRQEPRWSAYYALHSQLMAFGTALGHLNLFVIQIWIQRLHPRFRSFKNPSL